MKAQPWQTNKHAAIMAQPIARIQPSRPNLCRQPSSLQAQPIHIVKHYTKYLKKKTLASLATLAKTLTTLAKALFFP